MFRRLPSMLSGGEQQRVAIARALASKTEIILADEPTGNLDTENGQNIVQLLKDLAVSENVCVIVVTHDIAVAEQADVVLRISDGRIVI
jgi:putative ABC transport system ATP-binding protein